MDTGSAVVTRGGTTLTLTLTVTFRVAFSGTQQLWTSANGNSAASGWTQAGSFTVSAPPHTVSTLSVSPNSGLAATQTFSFRFFDSSGTGYLQTLSMWFTPAFSSSNAASCLVTLNQPNSPSASLSLRNDAGTDWISSPVNAGANLQNSQCLVNGRSVAYTGGGNVFTLTLTLTFARQFSGNKEIWMNAAEASTASGWQKWGTFETNDPPEVIRVAPLNPASGSGPMASLNFSLTDSNGAVNLSAVTIWITPSFSAGAANTCQLKYDPASGQLTLLDDAGIAFNGPGGTPAKLANHQCSATAGGMVTANHLELNVAVNFTPTYGGAKEVWVYALGSMGNSGWQKAGTWTAPMSISIVPDWLFGGSGNVIGGVTFETVDLYGGADVQSVWAWFTPTFSDNRAGTCMFYYSAAANTYSLLNDAGTDWTSAIAGPDATLQNSQCTLTSLSRASVNGLALYTGVSIKFASAFAGPKQVWQYSVGTTANTGWQKIGDWTVGLLETPSVVSVTPT
ncbi:MAG TPA: hypothetical protein VGH38_33180, partial [Bryobacteraceae bacterium]